MASRGTLRRSHTARRSSVTLYRRNVICSLCRVSEHQLGIWEREELIVPAQVIRRGSRPEPLYDESALKRVRVIRTLAEELEVNLPGISVILNLLDRIAR
jgi:DNA-binding transcriptional MerR regulator